MDALKYNYNNYQEWSTVKDLYEKTESSSRYPFVMSLKQMKVDVEMNQLECGSDRQRLTGIQLLLLAILVVSIGGYSFVLWQFSFVSQSVRQLRMLINGK